MSKDFGQSCRLRVLEFVPRSGPSLLSSGSSLSDSNNLDCRIYGSSFMEGDTEVLMLPFCDNKAGGSPDCNVHFFGTIDDASSAHIFTFGLLGQ